jgi:hypothetical protein
MGAGIGGAAQSKQEARQRPRALRARWVFLTSLMQDRGRSHALAKRLHGTTIHLPNRTKDRPDQERLALRFERFKAAA